MRDKTGDKQRLLHIIDAIIEVENYVKDATPDTLRQNSMMRFACVKQIEIIGEASNHITEVTKTKVSNIHWKQIIGMRHILVHEYFGIDTDVVWDVINNELPKLKYKILEIIDTL